MIEHGEVRMKVFKLKLTRFHTVVNAIFSGLVPLLQTISDFPLELDLPKDFMVKQACEITEVRD
jgi:hypothetical protein